MKLRHLFLFSLVSTFILSAKAGSMDGGSYGVGPDAAPQSQVIFAGQTDYLLGGSLIVYDGSIRRVLFEGGYATATHQSLTTYSFDYFYYNRDHLGNNREVVSASGQVQQVTNYYPFGAPYADAAATKGSAIQQYKYNGKELDVTHGLNTYDYGARQYDPILGRWDRVDPLAEKNYPTSPYVYCGNNPVNRVDKDGRIWDTVLDVAFLAYDLGEAAYQFCTAGSISNTTKAALGADALAAIVPGLTGTGLAVRAGAKATEVGSKVNIASKIVKSSVHGNSKASTNAQHAYDIINTKTNKVVKTGVIGGPIKDGKSVRAETQVKKWNKQECEGTYKSEITHQEPEGEGARSKILEYEKDRANSLREELQTEDKHKRP